MNERDETAEPGGPRAMAETLVMKTAELEAKIAELTDDPEEAKRLRKMLKINRDMLRWCKSRAGY